MRRDHSTCRADERELIARIHRASAERAYENIFSPDEAFPWDQTLARWLNFVGEVLVAESHETDDLIGFVAFDEHELHALYVLPEYWDCGIGGHLLEAASGVAQLWVLEGNTRARRFYESRGWKPDGTWRQLGRVTELCYRRTERRIDGT
jgi:GNAT superfamily N-acetyltransferase